jgi:hypothetical protein
MYEIAVFISHSWTYSEHYDTLADWIFHDQWNVNGVPILFSDLSVPKYNPIHFANSEAELRGAIYTKIALTGVVVIPTGMYANHSNWIQKEIDGAVAFNKPILAVNPWAQERKSSVVSLAATKTVGWNRQSVVTGIWDLRS